MNGFPHGICLLWNTRLVFAHVSADLLIMLAYYVIPFVLYRIRKKISLDVPPDIWSMFVVFIAACGTTHLMDAVVVFYPVYRIQAVIKWITVLASAGTALALIPLMPRLLKLPTKMEQMQSRLDAVMDKLNNLENHA